MRTLAEKLYLDSECGALCELPKVGSALENPYVYDASAQELKAMSSAGLVRIVDEKRRAGASGRLDGLIERLTFERLR